MNRKKLVIIILAFLVLVSAFSYMSMSKNLSRKLLYKNKKIAETGTNSRLPIKNLVIIVQENHSFDSYFGTYPGADGLDLNLTLPKKRGEPPSIKPVKAHNYSIFKRSATRAYNKDVDRGRKDANGIVVMEYYDRTDIPNYWTYADNFVLLDRMFSPTIIRYSIPSQLYIIAATASGWTTNAMEKSELTDKTIIDYLLKKNISWKYYAGKRLSKVANAPKDWNMILHYKQHKNDSRVKKNIVPVDTYFEDVENGKLPQVAWVMSVIEESEHPPYDVRKGMNFVTSVVNSLMMSKYWKESAIIILWDDYGFFYDHVKPLVTDEFGPGPRVPGLVISPYAKKGFIDHSTYTTSSPLKLIETIFNLPSLTARDANSPTMLNAFDFDQPPRPPLIFPTVPVEK